MFKFCTFSLTFKHTDLHFFLEILALLMKFLVLLCGGCVIGPLASKIHDCI